MCDAFRTLLMTKTKNKLLTHADNASNKFAYSRYNGSFLNKNIKFFDDPKHDSNLTLNFATFLIYKCVQKITVDDSKFYKTVDYTFARYLPRSPEY